MFVIVMEYLYTVSHWIIQLEPLLHISDSCPVAQCLMIVFQINGHAVLCSEV